MVAVIMRRMKLIKARAARLATKPKPVDYENGLPPSFGDGEVRVVDMITQLRSPSPKGSDTRRRLNEESQQQPEVEKPRYSSGAAILADRLNTR
jgi:hypothetical protein